MTKQLHMEDRQTTGRMAFSTRYLKMLLVLMFCAFSALNARAQTLSGSTACTGSVLTVTGSLTPTQIIWQLGGFGISTVVTTYSGAIVAGGNGSGVAANQLHNPGGLYVDSSGNIYVTDYGNARVQKWSPGATTGITVAGSSTGVWGSTANQLDFPTGVYVDGSGNIYVADYSNARIQEWAPGATSGTTVAGTGVSGSGNNQFNGPFAVYVDGSGNIYVADVNNNRVQEWAPGATTGIPVAGTGVAGSGVNQLNSPHGVYVDGSGNIYVSDVNNNRVQEWAPGATAGTTVAGNGTAGTGANQLNYPVGVYVDSSGNIYVGDFNNNRVQKWAPGATTGITVAGSSTGISGSGVNQLHGPEGVYVNGQGSIYVVEQGNNRVQEFNPYIITTYNAAIAGNYTALITTATGSVTTNTVAVSAIPTISCGGNVSIYNGSSTTLAASGGLTYTWAPGTGLTATTGASVTANPATAITYTVTGANSSGCSNTAEVTVSVSDSTIPTLLASTNCPGGVLTVSSGMSPKEIVWQLDGVGVGTVTPVFDTNGVAIAGGNGSGAAANQLHNATGVYVDGNGNIYVADELNNRVQEWTPGATTGITVAGSSAGVSGNGASQLHDPTSVYLDNAGNIYVADYANNRVQKWAAGATAGTTVAGTGVAGSGASQLHGPYGISVDGSENIYIADISNDRVQKWAAGATAGTTVAGTGVSGTGANQLNSPEGLYVDAGGNIYIADYGNDRIQKWAPGATSGATVAGTTGAIGTGEILLHSPTGVCVDGAGNVYVCDYENNRVQEWAPGAITGTTIAGSKTGTSGSGANRLNLPNGICMDGLGNMYISDQSNSRVQEFAASIIATYNVVTAGNYAALVTTEIEAITTNTVTVNANPVIIVRDTDIYIGSSATLAASGGTTYTWMPGTGLSATTGASVTANPGSTITYMVTGTAAGCSSTTDVTVSVGTVPALTGSSACAPATLAISSSLLPTQIVWQLGGTGVSTVTATIMDTTGITVAGVTGLSGDAANELAYPDYVYFDGVYVDGAGNIYVADEGNNRIQKWAPGATAGTTVAGGGNFGLGANQLRQPSGVWVDGSGNIYIADQVNYRIQKWAPGATAGTTVAGQANGSRGIGANQLYNPIGLYVDGAGNIYVADAANNRIQLWAPGATAGTTVAGQANGVSGNAANQFYAPHAVYVDGSGNVYVADAGNNRIQKWAPGATAGTTVAGTGVSGSGGSQLNNPSDVNVDAGGNVYVADAGNNRIQKWAPGATAGITVAGTGVSGTGSEQLNYPTGLYVDGSGNIYVADNNNSRVQEFLIYAANTYTAAAPGNYSAIVATGAGTAVTNTVTINGAPTITSSGNVAICSGNPTSLAAGGAATYTWLPGTGLSATTGAGVIATPTTTTTYTITGTTVCSNTATVTVTVNTLPSSTGATNSSPVCSGGSVTLNSNSNDATGWSWAGSDGSSSTMQNPVMSPMATTSYSLAMTNSATGCSQSGYTTIVTVNIAPSSTGATNSGPVCSGGSVTLNSNSSNATNWSWVGADGSSSTLQNPVMTPTATTTYSLTMTNTTTGCSQAATYITIVSINATTAGTITGSTSVNIGSNITLADAVGGGAWSASNANAIVSGGIVTGEGVGSVTISYAVTGSCGTAYATKTITINNTGITGINGIASVCVGATTYLTDATGGGVWSSNNAGAASIVSSTGVVTGVAAGNAVITYTAGAYYTTIVVTIDASPNNIAGVATACVGAPVLIISDATSGGAWSSSNANAGVTGAGATGTVTAYSAGTAILTYQLSDGCYRNLTVTVNPVPPVIMGNPLICGTGTTVLSDAMVGGAWSSSNPGGASIGATSGVVTSEYVGNYTITYTLAGCHATMPVTVGGAPSAINGNTSVCPGLTVSLTNLVSGGVWSSGNPAAGSLATGGSGVVMGVAAGATTISYTLGSGCAVYKVVTVNAAPAISGISAICTGATLPLTDAGTGVWSTGKPAVATIGSASGIVMAVSGGTATISYALSDGCMVTVISTVNANPGGINGVLQICQGLTLGLTDATTGGLWSSGNTTVGTLGTSSSGIISAIGAGTAAISYTLSSGCMQSVTITVNPVPANGITGLASLCASATTTLSDLSTGGTWSSSNAAIATIGSSTGFAAAAAAGTTTISYTISGCAVTQVLTVNVHPAAITGATSECFGGTPASVSDATSGGTWSSANTVVGITGTGTTATVVANNIGTSTLTYAIGACYTTYPNMANTPPAAITGSPVVCGNGTTALSNATPGGIWSTMYNGVSVGSSSGVVTGATVGVYTVGYTISATTAIYTVTVVPAPSAIIGNLSVCAGATTSLSDLSYSGTWTSGNLPVAVVNSSSSFGTVDGIGIIGSVAAGTATISYTLPNTCMTTSVVTVNAYPSVPPISGPTTIALGTPVTLSDATAGGVWTSSNTNIALSGTGSLVTTTAENTSGSAVIKYTVNVAGCSTSVTQTETNTAPPHHAGETGGTTSVYAGSTYNIVDISGGSWGSNDNGIATVDDNGTVTGIKVGAVNITHTSINGNGDVTTNTTPVSAIAPPASISLRPNPNKGTFTVTGTVGSIENEEVTLEVTNVLGQVIYGGHSTALNGRLDEIITLNNSLANGMYILNVQSTTAQIAIHFVMEN